MDYLELSQHHRYHLGTVKHTDIYKIYEDSRSMTWNENEIASEMRIDKHNKAVLPENERITLLNILSFFASGDGIVNETSSTEIMPRITIMEACMVYRLFMAQEDIHNIVYTKLVELYSKNKQEVDSAFNSLFTMKSVKAKKEWSDKWSKNASVAQVLLCNIIIEGLFFSSSFCYIFWLAEIHKGLLPGLANSNEWISRDEGNHTMFGVMMYLKSGKCPDDIIYQMFEEAINAELLYVQEIFDGKKFPGMNEELMFDYIRFVANDLLACIKCAPMKHVDNPFPFMIKQSTGVRIGDFFNRDTSDYGLNDIETEEENILRFDTNF